MSDAVQIQKLQIDSETKEASIDTTPKSICNNDNDNSTAKPPSKPPSNPSNPPKPPTTRKRKLSSIEDSEMKDSNPPKKKRKKSRGWSSSEETLFRSGLELYGRDWKKLAKHVGNNRTPASIRSHAQVYFLSMLKNGNKLPNKILESGNGFTLSGKPLNKYSTCAIRYFGGATNVPMVDGVISDEESAKKLKSKPKKNKNNNNNKSTKSKTNATKKPKKKRRNKYDSDDSDEDYSYAITTNNNNNNEPARRSGRNRKKTHFHDPPHESNPFGLRTDLQFYDINNGNKINKNDYKIYEPFKIEYCPNALLIADIHSHLLRNIEIMGLLGGNYDKMNGILHIKKCYPVAEEQHNEKTVHADSIDYLRITELIASDGFELIGWYHSHPCFENVPSNLDCFQHSMSKYENENDNPYIGLIIQSLWERNDGISNYKWFNTLPLNKGINDHEYIALQFIANHKNFYDMNSKELFEQIKLLIQRYAKMKYDLYRTNFGESGIDKRILNNITNKLITHEMNDDNNGNNDIVKVFVDKIEKLFMENKDVWWVTNAPKNINNVDDKENENCLN